MLSAPLPPYYAVIFSSTATNNQDGYAAMSEDMKTLAAQQPGFLAIESARHETGGITVSYWQSLEDIRRWKANLRHLQAQKLGRDKWYSRYQIRIARVEKAYGFNHE